MNEPIPLERYKQLSFDRKVIDMTKISHQHLSNCVWYNTIFRGNLEHLKFELQDLKREKSEVVRAQNYEKAVELRNVEKRIMDEIEESEASSEVRKIYKRALDERFDGVLLPYHPHPNFELEIRDLMRMNMLSCTPFGYDIFLNEQKIGDVNFINPTL